MMERIEVTHIPEDAYVEPKVIELYPLQYAQYRHAKRLQRIRIYWMTALVVVLALGFIWLIYWK